MTTIDRTKMAKIENYTLLKLKELQVADRRGVPVKFRFTRGRKTLGVCAEYYSKITGELDYIEIGISSALAKTASFEETRNTVLHEIAHAIAGNSAGHGSVWKNIFKDLGGNGEQYASLTQSVKKVANKYALVDSRNNKTIKTFARKPTKDYSKCYVGSDISSLGKLKIIKL